MVLGVQSGGSVGYGLAIANDNIDVVFRRDEGIAG